MREEDAGYVNRIHLPALARRVVNVQRDGLELLASVKTGIFILFAYFRVIWTSV